jgi:hypothetical protein
MVVVPEELITRGTAFWLESWISAWKFRSPKAQEFFSFAYQTPLSAGMSRSWVREFSIKFVPS